MKKLALIIYLFFFATALYAITNSLAINKTLPITFKTIQSNPDFLQVQISNHSNKPISLSIYFELFYNHQNIYTARTNPHNFQFTLIGNSSYIFDNTIFANIYYQPIHKKTSFFQDFVKLQSLPQGNYHLKAQFKNAQNQQLLSNLELEFKITKNKNIKIIKNFIQNYKKDLIFQYPEKPFSQVQPKNNYQEVNASGDLKKYRAIKIPKLRLLAQSKLENLLPSQDIDLINIKIKNNSKISSRLKNLIQTSFLDIVINHIPSKKELFPRSHIYLKHTKNHSQSKHQSAYFSQVLGHVQYQSHNKWKLATIDTSIQEKNIIKTSASSFAQLIFSQNGAILSIGPETELKILSDKTSKFPSIKILKGAFELSCYPATGFNILLPDNKAIKINTYMFTKIKGVINPKLQIYVLNGHVAIYNHKKHYTLSSGEFLTFRKFFGPKIIKYQHKPLSLKIPQTSISYNLSITKQTPSIAKITITSNQTPSSSIYIQTSNAIHHFSSLPASINVPIPTSKSTSLILQVPNNPPLIYTLTPPISPKKSISATLYIDRIPYPATLTFTIPHHFFSTKLMN